MKQLKQKDIKEVREILSKKVDYLCPVTGLDISNGDCCLDHAHYTSTHPKSETVEGQIRGPLHKYANALEGQMLSKFKRSGLNAVMSFEEFLFNLYTYLMEFREPMIHPMSAPKNPKLQKSSYNALVREINGANKYLQKPIKVPSYPKSKRLTKKLKELYEQFGMFPKYYMR